MGFVSLVPIIENLLRRHPHPRVGPILAFVIVVYMFEIDARSSWRVGLAWLILLIVRRDYNVREIANFL